MQPFFVFAGLLLCSTVSAIAGQAEQAKKTPTTFTFVGDCVGMDIEGSAARGGWMMLHFRYKDDICLYIETEIFPGCFRRNPQCYVAKGNLSIQGNCYYLTAKKVASRDADRKLADKPGIYMTIEGDVLRGRYDMDHGRWATLAIRNEPTPIVLYGKVVEQCKLQRGRIRVTGRIYRRNKNDVCLVVDKLIRVK